MQSNQIKANQSIDQLIKQSTTQPTNQ